MRIHQPIEGRQKCKHAEVGIPTTQTDPGGADEDSPDYEPIVRVDCAANVFDWISLHRPASDVGACLSLRPKKRGPFHRVPVIAKATLVRLL